MKKIITAYITDITLSNNLVGIEVNRKFVIMKNVIWDKAQYFLKENQKFMKTMKNMVQKKRCEMQN